MPKTKRNFNNASSVGRCILTEDSMPTNYKSDNKTMLEKHKIARESYVNETGKDDDADYDTNGTSMPVCSGEQPEQMSTVKPIVRQFIINESTLKTLLRFNFPARYPLRFSQESSVANVIVQEANDELVPISTTTTNMTKNFVNFWNRLVTKQDVCTRSILDHQLTDMEAGYYPCQLKSLFNSPESYVKKDFCAKGKYTGLGYQFLPANNCFTRISARSKARSEICQIFQHYSNPANQYFLIPIELSSKLSRSMLRSLEISQQTQGCNKIDFVCDIQNVNGSVKHPLLTLEYKSSIELEYLPPASFCLVDNYALVLRMPNKFKNECIKKALFNYPYLCHMFYRTDFWIEDLFARFWHYTRFFCDKLDNGNRLNLVRSLIIKDTMFKYLLSSAVRICVAIKYWVMNPKGASYLRCWCGQRVYNEIQESKMLGRYHVGTSDLVNYQLKVRNMDMFHNKHKHRKSNHICACGQKFKNHNAWMNHAFSLKLCDLSKLCPIVIYNFSRLSQESNKYVCECQQGFSDYDFWSFWLHACNCKVLKDASKAQCSCNEKQPRVSCTQNTAVTRKRTRSKVSKSKRYSVRQIVVNEKKKDLDHGDGECDDEKTEECIDSKVHDVADTNDGSSKEEDSNHQSGDNIDLPLKVSHQQNSNKCTIIENSRKRIKYN